MEPFLSSVFPNTFTALSAEVSLWRMPRTQRPLGLTCAEHWFALSGGRSPTVPSEPAIPFCLLLQPSVPPLVPPKDCPASQRWPERCYLKYSWEEWAWLSYWSDTSIDHLFLLLRDLFWLLKEGSRPGWIHWAELCPKRTSWWGWVWQQEWERQRPNNVDKGGQWGGAVATTTIISGVPVPWKRLFF